MFPFAVYGFIHIRNVPNAYAAKDRAAHRIAHMLENRGANASVESSQVRFTAGWRLAGGRNDVLVPFDSGTIRVEQQNDALKISYSLSTLRMAVVVAALSLLFALPAIPGPGKAFDPNKLMPMVYAWLWLYGGNYVLGTIRVPFWLKRGLKGQSR